MAPDTVVNDETRTRLVELLAQARAAHQTYETIRLKHADPNWATWYAGFVLERGFERVWPDLKEAQLAAMLQDIDREYQNAGADQNWAEFVVHRLIQTS